VTLLVTDTSSLVSLDVLVIPMLMMVFVVRSVLETPEIRVQLADVAADRSRETNAYYERTRRRLDRLD
jgi:hypothetical protein